MKLNFLGLIALFILFVATNGFAQAGHGLQLDDGASHYSTILGSNPGGTYILPPGGGTLLTSTSLNGLAWVLGGNTGSSPNNQIGTLDATTLQLVTGGVANVRLSISGAGLVSIGTALSSDPSGVNGWTNNLKNPLGRTALQIGTSATANGFVVHASNLVTNNAGNSPTPADGYSVYTFTGNAFTGTATLPGVATAGKILHVINATTGGIFINAAGGSYFINPNFAGEFISNGTNWYPIGSSGFLN